MILRYAQNDTPNSIRLTLIPQKDKPMPRATMSQLITRLRTLTGDPAGAGQAFTDDQYQPALDKTKRLPRFLLLTPILSTPPYTQTAEYQAQYTDWEEGAILYDSAATNLTGLLLSQDSLTGLFTFTLPRTPPVYISGQFYDLYKAAVDILESWSATLKLNYPFSNQGTSVGGSRANLTAQFEQILQLADCYRTKVKPRTVVYTRDDIEPEE